MSLETHRAGEHEVIREADDFFVYRFAPDLSTREQITELAEPELRAWAEGLDYVYSITILAENHTIQPGALTASAKIYGRSPPRTSAFVVRGFFTRTSMEFLVRAVRAFGVPLEVRLFSDEASARAWVEARRAERSCAAAS